MIYYRKTLFDSGPKLTAVQFEVIMAQNLLLKTCGVGYLALGSKLLTLNRVAPGKMAFVKALTAPSETTFWMGRSSIA